MRTYLWSDAINTVKRLCKSIPVPEGDQIKYSQIVSSKMWTAYPWKESKTTIAAGLLPLVDGHQDYSTPANFYLLTKGSIIRTDTTPNQTRELDVVQESDVDLVSRSPYAIQSIASQAGVGQLRLESAVQISTGTTWEIRGEFQNNPDKIDSLSKPLWTHDHYFDASVAGLLYYFYKQADDARAGNIVMDQDSGKIRYTGQLGEWMAWIQLMKSAEDRGGTDGIFPGEPMGTGRDSSGLTIFAF